MKTAETTGCICRDECKIYTKMPEIMPEGCPTKVHSGILDRAKELYKEEGSDARKIWEAFARLLHTGGAKKSRFEHVVDFCLAMDAKKIGVASCVRYLDETNYIKDTLKGIGLECHTVLCKVGGFQTKDICIEKDTDWLICNPLSQALILNDLGCEVNITLGLCMGQELIFNRYTKGFVTNLIVKEKITDDRPRDTIKSMIGGDYVNRFHIFEG